jgi:hypothetical protein
VELVRLVQGPERLPAVCGLVGSAGSIWTHPGLLVAASAGGYALERGSVLLVRGLCSLLARGHERLAGSELGLTG